MIDWFGIQRRKEERQNDREHQQALLQLFLRSLEVIQEKASEESKANANALVEVAHSVAAQAQSFSKWLECFHTTPTPVASTVISEEDEYRIEQLENYSMGLPFDIQALPQEYQAAFALRNDPNLKGLDSLLQ